MKLMNRNKKTLAYRLYMKDTKVVDENGFRTGERDILYSDKQYVKAMIGKPSSFIYLEPYGNIEDYDRILLFDDMTLPFDENTIFFIDDVEGESHDYEVFRVRPTLTILAVMVRKVKANGY